MSAVNRHVTAGPGHPTSAGRQRGLGRSAPASAAISRRGLRWWSPVPIAVLAAAGAATDGYLIARNPNATPAALSVGGVVVTILALATGAVYAQHSAMLARYGRVLAMATLVAVVSSLSASAGRFPSTMGLLASGLVPIVICALLLTYPSGRLRDRNDRLLLAVGGGVLFTSSTALVVLGSIRFSNLALAHCAAGCPGVASLTLTGPIANGLQVLAIAAMLCLAWGTVASLRHRARLMSLPLRRALAPVRVAALTYALWLSAWRISAHFAPGVATLLDDGVLFLAVLVPLAVVIGGAWQRLYMGDALAEFVAALGQRPGADPQAVMAVTLRDPTLRLGYRPPGGRTYATIDGHPVDPGRAGPDQAVTWIERGHRRVACVVYDADLVDQESFIRAAGAAALMLQERAQLKADLRAYAAGLAASRNRLLKKADAERQSLERDLHDGVQQDLVALRIKIELAEEAMGDDPARSRQMLNAMAHHMDEVLETLRTLARGIYPALLERQGLDDALRSVARRSPLPISVDARTIGRYRRDIEAAVYFCCLEAMQNATKHAGRGAAISVRLAQEDGHLRFEVRDTGVGFDAGQTNGEHGVLNMRDRIEAVDGTLAIDSWSGGGTIVSGRVPVGADVGPAWPAAA